MKLSGKTSVSRDPILRLARVSAERAGSALPLSLPITGPSGHSDCPQSYYCTNYADVEAADCTPTACGHSTRTAGR